MLTQIRHLPRAFQAGSVLLRHLLAPLLRPSLRRAEGPARLRRAFEELGGAWVKLGQALALRLDLLPPEYCQELFKLLNEVKPFPFADVRRIILEDLKRPPEEVFASFEEEAFAAASIGQVHRAVLHDGERVAVKVQRPHIRQLIMADLGVMYLFSGLLDRTRLLGATRTRRVVDEFARWTMDELDYRIEAHHAERLRRNSREEQTERVARIHRDLSSERVLTMEFLDGIPLIEILYALRAADANYLNALKEKGHDLATIAENLTWNLLNQIYRFGYFHADLHPANLFVLPDNVIGYVDFGIVGKLPPEVRESLAHYAWNLYEGNTDRAAEEFMRWVSPSEGTDTGAARVELTRVIDDYLSSIAEPGRKLGREGSAAFELEILNSIRRHQMVFSPSIVTYLKALVTADTLIFELAPDFDLRGMENHFFQYMMVRETRDLLDAKKLAHLAFDYGHRLQRALDALESAVEPNGFNGKRRAESRSRVASVLLVCAWVAAIFYVARTSARGEALWLQEPLIIVTLLGAFALVSLLAPGRN